MTPIPPVPRPRGIRCGEPALLEFRTASAALCAFLHSVFGAHSEPQPKRPRRAITKPLNILTRPRQFTETFQVIPTKQKLKLLLLNTIIEIQPLLHQAPVAPPHIALSIGVLSVR